MTQATKFFVLLTALLILASGCRGSNNNGQPPVNSGGQNADQNEADEDRKDTDWSVSTIAENLNAPWEIVFTPQGRVFLTERDQGHVLELEDGETSVLREFPVDDTSEGGLLGLAVSPTFEDDGLLYTYMTSDEDNRILRFPVDDPDNTEVVLQGIPDAPIHNGGRIAFGPDGFLYVGTGDAAEESRSQDLMSTAGKILRLHPDGTIPQDNPFEDSLIYAYGFRNVQGLTWDAKGQLYATDFGPNRDDEVNRIEAGQNYGWPEVTGQAENPAFEDPIFVRQPPQASWSGLTILVDGAIPQWEGNLFIAALRGNRLWQLVLSQDRQEVTETEELFTEWGRLRQVTQAPDGSLWVLTNNRDGRGNPAPEDDRIYRIGP